MRGDFASSSFVSILIGTLLDIGDSAANIGDSAAKHWNLSETLELEHLNIGDSAANIDDSAQGWTRLNDMRMNGSNLHTHLSPQA